MNWSVIKGFLSKEFSQNFRDPVMLRLLFVVPIFQIIVFGTALNNETTNIRLAIFGSPSDTKLLELKNHAIATGLFVNAELLSNDPFEEVQSSRAEVAIVSQEKGLLVLGGPKQIELQFLIDGTDSVRAMAINNYLNQITKKMFLEFKPPSKNIEIVSRVLYNPQLKTSFFLIPGLMGIMACMITVLLTSMGFTREKEMGTLENIISAPVNKSEIILGKALPSLILALFNMILVCAVAMIVFNMPFNGQFWLFLLTAFVFIISTIAIGIGIATLSNTQQQAMMGSFLFIFPSLLLSGMMFPIENMPDWMLILAEINPLTHFNQIVRNIILKSGDISFVLEHLLIIAGVGIICAFAAFKNFKITLN